MNARAAFVVVGLMVNALALGRGVVLMLALDYAELGFVALVQAAITFIGMLHFGLLNGGYRLLCHAGPRTRQRIIDLAYTSFATIAGALTLAALAVLVFEDQSALRQISAFALVGGVATLMRSWIMNELVARGSLGSANILNAVSMIASLAALAPLALEPLAWDPLPLSRAVIAMAAIIAQPILFVSLALISGAAQRPRRLRASRRLARIVLGSGFIMFASGLGVQCIAVMERAYVSRALGLEALGHLYLAILFVTVFQIAPTLIQQVFLPVVVKLWRMGDAGAIQRELRLMLGVMIAYCAVAALALWSVAQPLVTLALPGHACDLRWVYWVAPGLMTYALAAPFSLLFNVVIDYRWYGVAAAMGVSVTALALGTASLAGAPLDLDQVTWLRSAVFALMGAVLVAGSWRLARRFPEFRLFGRGHNGLLPRAMTRAS